jgi:hypothetical protein
MGKASSSKKVARAARAGGPIRPDQRKLGFPIAVVAIMVLGLGLVVLARQGFTENRASAESPSPSDHWHAAYGFYVCDTFLPPLIDQRDRTGIHTHDDGVIHIHPFSAAHAGKNATLGKWGDAVDVNFGGSSITMPDGTEYKQGYDCNGQPASVKVYKWPADDPNAPPEIFESDFGKIRLDTDRAAFTIAVVPDGVEVPRPESIPNLDQLSDVPGAVPGEVPGGEVPLDPLSPDPGFEIETGDPGVEVPDAGTPSGSPTGSPAPSDPTEGPAPAP